MKGRGAPHLACYPGRMRLRSASLVVVFLAAGCASTEGTKKKARSGVDPSQVALEPGDVAFTGMCDASGAVPLGGGRFAVADDEDNILRVYDAERGGAPVATIDVSSAILPPPPPSSPGAPAYVSDARISPHDEADLEGATRVGDTAYWITSHARSKKGRREAARLRFFATTTPADGETLRVIASTDRLLGAILAEPRHAHLGLEAAAAVSPTAPGGLNIEGLGRRAEDGVWIAFRSPVIDGKALLIGLRNPLEFVQGEPPRFVDPVLLDLGGLGVRSISWWHGRHPIVAGHAEHGSSSRLYVWDEKSAPRIVPGVDLSGFNAEAFFSVEARDKVMLLSDNGTVKIGGKKCKRLADPSRKTFHGRWVALPG
jgi:hypothetical protein